MLVGILVGAATVAFAWLTPGQNVPVSAEGSAVASYFARGTGTSEDPYILNQPKHVYNLAWLQYLGTFNVTDENGTITAAAIAAAEAQIVAYQEKFYKV